MNDQKTPDTTKLNPALAEDRHDVRVHHGHLASILTKEALALDIVVIEPPKTAIVDGHEVFQQRLLAYLPVAEPMRLADILSGARPRRATYEETITGERQGWEPTAEQIDAAVKQLALKLLQSARVLPRGHGPGDAYGYSLKTLGQVGYEAYGAYGGAAGMLTFDRRPMPTWEQLSESDTGRETRRRWEVAARAIRESDAEPDHDLLNRD